MTSDLLMLPDDPNFERILATNPPPGSQGSNEIGAMVMVMGVDGMPRNVTDSREFNDYLYGGEYDLVYQEDDPDLDQDYEEETTYLEGDLLWL